MYFEGVLLLFLSRNSIIARGSGSGNNGGAYHFISTIHVSNSQLHF